MKSFYTLSQTVAFNTQTSNVALGNAGERLAIALFTDSDFLAEKITERYAGDIRVTDKKTGEINKIEVKIARASNADSPRWQFCINKRGFTSCGYSDFCLLFAVFRGGIASYLVPCVELKGKQKVEVSHPNKYRGWLRKYQLKPNQLVKFNEIYGVKNRYA